MVRRVADVEGGQRVGYCRFSSDDFQCDVYVYHDVGGWWQTWVAASRAVFKEPMPGRVDTDDPDWGDHYFGRHQEVMAIRDDADRVDIGGPYDGRSFQDPTPGDCAERLVMLREAGYNVPQYAIDELREEARP